MQENRKRGDGSWGKRVINGSEYVTFAKWIGTSVRKKATVYGKTDKECLKKMKKKEAEYAELVSVTGSLMLPSQNKIALQDAMWNWILTYKKYELKPKAFDTLVSTFNTHVKDTSIGRMEVRNISKDDITRCLNSIYDKRSYSTVKKLYDLFNMFFRHYFLSAPAASPMLGVNRPVKKKDITLDEEGIADTGEMEVLSDAEIAALDKELYTEKTTMCYMLSFIMWSFVRLGEAQAIQMKDIDLEKGTLKIYKTYGRVKKEGAYSDEGESGYEWKLFAPKTQKSKRVVRLCPKALEALNNHLRILKTKRIDVLGGVPEIKPETFIFSTLDGNPYAGQNLGDLLKKSLKRAGIEKAVTIHGLRHTGISYFLRHEADLKTISVQAGHSNVATTANIYYNVVQDQIDGLYQKEYWKVS